MLRAIDTHYAGCRFRSRLEARWAVFFDCLGIPWEYEREGYELPSGWYLPDFWLPQAERFIEIKGQSPTKRELILCGELSLASLYPVAVFHGTPGEHSGQCYMATFGGIGSVATKVIVETFFEGPIERAAAAARSARFEFGEGVRFQKFK